MENILRGLHIEVLFWLAVPLLFLLLVLVTLVRLKLKSRRGAQQDGNERERRGP